MTEKFDDEALARHLASLPQPEPCAELDAAILSAIKDDLAPRADAANDAASARDVGPAPRPSFLQRYRVPLALAACAAGVSIALPIWRQDPLTVGEVVYNEQKQAQHPQPEAAPAQEPAGVAPAVQKAAPAPAPASVPPPAVPKREKPAFVAQQPAPAPALEQPAPPPAPVTASAARVAPAPVPATPAPAATPSAGASPAPPPTESARTAPMADYRSVAPVPTRRADTPETWLEAIQAMLDAGLNRDAAEEWARFRAAHPNYTVAEPLASRLKQLER